MAYTIRQTIAYNLDQLIGHMRRQGASREDIVLELRAALQREAGGD